MGTYSFQIEMDSPHGHTLIDVAVEYTFRPGYAQTYYEPGDPDGADIDRVTFTLDGKALGTAFATIVDDMLDFESIEAACVEAEYDADLAAREAAADAAIEDYKLAQAEWRAA